MHLHRQQTHQAYKRSRLMWCALALACLVLVQWLGLVHQTQHDPDRAGTGASHWVAQPGLSVAFEQAAHDHAAHHTHAEHGQGDVLGHDQGGVTCQLIDVAAGAVALLAAVVATVACGAGFACPLKSGSAGRTHAPFALYCARAPPARLA